MMVGNKDSGGGAAKTGVVAPVPINTPSLRQEIHGSQGDSTGIASINRSSSGGGWGSASGASSSEANPASQGTAGGSGRGRADGTRQGGDDVFTRHFPDLRAGLEQAEKLDAVSKASSKVAPLRKPKPEPAKSQGPSLRPRGTQGFCFCRKHAVLGSQPRFETLSCRPCRTIRHSLSWRGWRSFLYFHAVDVTNDSLASYFSLSFFAGQIPCFSVSLRAAMLKPTGSAGGGSAATAAAQAAIADAVHNRVATAPKAEERRRPVASFADEISTKSRWTERPAQEGGARTRRGGRGGEGRGIGGSSWESNREGGRGAGRGGRGFDRGERGGGAFQDKDRRGFRHNPDRSSINSTRGRESIFGSGAHVGMAHSSQDNTTNGGAKTPTTTYVRQHGPPPRKLSTAAPTTAPTKHDDQPPAVQQPTRSSAYSASSRPSDESREDPWGKSTETSSKWRPAQQTTDAPTETPDSPSSSPQSASYVRAHGPPRRSGQDGGEVDEHGATSTLSRQDHDAGGEATSRFGGSWGASEQSRGALEKEPSAGVERTLSGRWKEPAGSLAPPPPPTNTRWKEPKEEPRAGVRRWSREEGQMGSGRWGRSVEEDGDVDGAVVHSPSHSNSWKESTNDGWGLEGGTHSREDRNASAAAASSATETSEQQHAGDDCNAPIAPIGTGGVVSGEETAERSDAKEPAVTTTAEGASPSDGSSFRGSFTQQQQQAQPVIRNASWEPQLPRGGGGGGGGAGDLWEAPVQGRDSHPHQQRSGQGGSSTSGGASQPWSDPWGTSGFGIPAGGDQGSRSMASFLESDEPRKDRYLPPALRNRTPSQGNHEDSTNDQSADQETNPIPASLPDTDVSAQDLVIPGRVGIAAPSPDSSSAGVAKAPMYEQQDQQQQQQQQQPPLEGWQQAGRGTQASHQIRQDQTGQAVGPQLNQQQQPVHHPQQVSSWRQS